MALKERQAQVVAQPERLERLALLDTLVAMARLVRLALKVLLAQAVGRLEPRV